MSVVDKEAGAILEALRTVTPEVAEQAVSYFFDYSGLHDSVLLLP
jgi:hypothetical protein